MLGGHERDRRRARLGLRSSGASLTIRHGLARFPWDGWIGLFNPKLRPIRRAISGLTWDFTAAARWRSDYFKVSGIGAPMSSKACRWALVGWVSIAMVTSVPVYRTWLRDSVARCSSRPRKLR